MVNKSLKRMALEALLLLPLPPVEVDAMGGCVSRGDDGRNKELGGGIVRVEEEAPVFLSCPLPSPVVRMLRLRLRTAASSPAWYRSPAALVRQASTSASPAAPPPPRPSYFTLATLYPFLLLSLLTSLAVNIAYGRTQHADEAALLRAQLSVLDRVQTYWARRSEGLAPAADAEAVEEALERELEMVGLGRAKGQERVKRGRAEDGTSWREVFLGKKGVEWTAREDADEQAVDWEQSESIALSFVSRPTTGRAGD